MLNIKMDEALWASSILPEGIVERWLVADGAIVAAGDPIATVRLEGALHDIVSPSTGRLTIMAAANAVVEPGSLLASLADEPDDRAIRLKILAVLGENRIMSIATLRPDGWPQATLVGYAHHDLTLYFVVGASSQKLRNIQREPRVSIAIGRDSPDHIRGLSMAALASVVTDFDEVERLNDLIAERCPQQILFAPRQASSAVLCAKPTIISVIDHSKEPGQPDVLRVTQQD